MKEGKVPQPEARLSTMNTTAVNKAIALSLKQYQMLCTIIAKTNPTKIMNNISYKKGTPKPNQPNNPIVINKTNT
jgi:hypothetical protein